MGTCLFLAVCQLLQHVQGLAHHLLLDDLEGRMLLQGLPRYAERQRVRVNQALQEAQIPAPRNLSEARSYRRVTTQVCLGSRMNVLQQLCEFAGSAGDKSRFAALHIRSQGQCLKLNVPC